MKLLNSSSWLRLYSLAVAFLFAATANAAWAAAGKFQFVSGDVRIVATDGRERTAIKGTEIEEGESVVSAAGASAQLLMRDGGVIAVRQDTRMRIDEYRFDGSEDGSERSFFSLLKGGFRSITGKIGKLHKENYRINTPAATIGIRGTDSETFHVTAANAGALNMPAGTYNRVNRGATVVNGTIVLPNQVAYAPNLNTPGTLLPTMPPIFEVSKAPPPKSTVQKTESTGESASATAERTTSSGGSSTESTSGETPVAPPDDAAPALTGVVAPPPPEPNPSLVGSSASTGGVVSAGGIYAAPIGYGGVGGDISWRTECLATSCYTGWIAGGGSVVLEPNTTRSIMLGSNGFPVLIAVTDAFGSMQYTAGTASLLDAGQTVVAGTTVRWGRYVGADSFVDSSGTRDPLVMNLMGADSVLSYTQAQAALTNMTSALSFQLVSGAGTVTDELNNVYHLVNGNLLVGYGGTNIQLNLTTDTVANRSWDLAYQGGLSQFYQEATATTGTNGSMGTSSLPLVSGSLKLNGALVSTSIKGEASGIFIGSGLTGALTSFSANALPSTALPSGASLSGTALLAR